MFGVLLDSDVEECGVQPLQSYADVCDGVQYYLCIEVLNQVVVQAAGRGRERQGGRAINREGSGEIRTLLTHQLSINCVPLSKASYFICRTLHITSHIRLPVCMY